MELNLLHLDLRGAELKRSLHPLSEAQRADLDEQSRLLWVVADHALDGVVLREDDMRRALQRIDGNDWCEQNLLDGVARLHGALEEAQAARAVINLEALRWAHSQCTGPRVPGGGRYRKNDAPQGPYSQKMVAAKSVSYRLRRAFDNYPGLAERLHPLQAGAHLHHEVMGIFPFDKHSGRAARLLLAMHLLREGYPLAPIPASARADYFAALCADTPGPLTALLVHFVDEGVSRAMRFTQATSNDAKVSHLPTKARDHSGAAQGASDAAGRKRQAS